MISLKCPRCHTEFPLSEARNDADWRVFVAGLVRLPSVCQVPMLDYMELFKPIKHSSVRSSRMQKLLAELLPMIQAQQINRGGKVYSIPHKSWAGAMNSLSNKRDTLSLPLKGNGYLLEMLANAAEKHEAKAEAVHIEKTRTARPDKPPVDENKRQKLIEIQADMMHARQMKESAKDDASKQFWAAEEKKFQQQTTQL